MAVLYEEKGFGPASELVAAASSPERIRAIDPKAGDLEGYLFPNTYALPRRATAETLVDAHGRRVRQGALARAAGTGGGARPLGSRARDAGVDRREGNRHSPRSGRSSPPSTATGCVSAWDFNAIPRSSTRSSAPAATTATSGAPTWSIDSPYNTYRYAGLPPGPIAAPGRAALEAAAAPADVPFLYFVSRNDGSHAFAATLDEHNRNVHKYQVEYFRERRSQRQP